MNRPLYCTLVAAALAAGPLIVGCERDVSKTETTKVKSDGTVESKEKKVTENPDGTVKLHGAAYYNFFAALSIGCVAFYVFVAKAYKEKTYLQGDAPAA